MLRDYSLLEAIVPEDLQEQCLRDLDRSMENRERDETT
jgi:hypothetical protein